MVRREPPANAAVVDAEREWFRLPLAAAYSAPFVLILSGAAISMASDDREAGYPLLYLAAASFAAPPIVHVAYGDVSGGLAAIPAAALSIMAGILLGGGIGSSVCDRDADGDCIGTTVSGAVLGGITGYAAWGVVDSVFLAYAASITDPPSATPRASTALAILPSLIPAGVRATGERARGMGLTIEVTLEL